MKKNRTLGQVPLPVQDFDIANKKYVDDSTAGFSDEFWKRYFAYYIAGTIRSTSSWPANNDTHSMDPLWTARPWYAGNVNDGSSTLPIPSGRYNIFGTLQFYNGSDPPAGLSVALTLGIHQLIAADETVLASFAFSAGDVVKSVTQKNVSISTTKDDKQFWDITYSQAPTENASSCQFLGRIHFVPVLG